MLELTRCVFRIVASIGLLFGIAGCTADETSFPISKIEAQTKTQIANSTQDSHSVELDDQELSAAGSNSEGVPVQQLLKAAFNGEFELVSEFLQSNPNQIDALDPDSRTPLMLASFNGHLDVVKKLLSAQANVNLKDAFGRTALMYASTGSDLEIVTLLVDHAAEINAADKVEKWSPLMFAASEGQVRIVQLLLERGADRSAQDIDGETSVDFARSKGHADVVWLLQNFVKQ